MTKAAKLADKSTYTSVTSQAEHYDFDNNRYWTFLVPALPAPYNNFYHSFRQNRPVRHSHTISQNPAHHKRGILYTHQQPLLQPENTDCTY